MHTLRSCAGRVSPARGGIRASAAIDAWDGRRADAQVRGGLLRLASAGRTRILGPLSSYDISCCCCPCTAVPRSCAAMAPPPPRALRYTRLRRPQLIAPAGSAAPPHARVALSRLDVNNAVLTAHSALFFGAAVDADALQASLAEALCLFPPLAGRVRPAPRCDAPERAAQGLSALDIHCCGSGAAFDVFSCDGLLSDFDASDRWHAAGEHTQPQSNTTPPVRPALSASARLCCAHAAPHGFVKHPKCSELTDTQSYRLSFRRCLRCCCAWAARRCWPRG